MPRSTKRLGGSLIGGVIALVLLLSLASSNGRLLGWLLTIEIVICSLMVGCHNDKRGGYGRRSGHRCSVVGEDANGALTRLVEEAPYEADDRG